MAFTGEFVLYIAHHFILVRRNPFDLSVDRGDSVLSILSHILGFSCQQRMLKTFPGYMFSEYGLV